MSAVLILSASDLPAATITKANNTNSLDQASSWVSGGPPGAGDIARWSSTVLGPNATHVGADMSWQGIEILDPGGGVVINTNSPATTLTMGSSGIYLSADSASLDLRVAAVLSSTQVWDVAATKSLYISGGMDMGEHDVVFAGGGNTILRTKTVFNGGNFYVNSGRLGLAEGSGAVDPTNLIIAGAGYLTVGDKSSSMAVEDTTYLIGGYVSTGNRAVFSTTGMKVSDGGYFLVASFGGGNTSVTIGSGGLVITQSLAGADEPIRWLYGNSSNRRAIMNLNGNVTFVADASNVNSATMTVGDATGTYGDGWFTCPAPELIFDVSDGAADIELIVQPRFTGAGMLVKAGAGTLEIQGKGGSTFSGGVTVSNGMLLVCDSSDNTNNTSATGTGDVIVEAGAGIGGTGSVTGNLSLASGAILAPGRTGGGTLTIGSNLVLGANSELNYDFGEPWQYDGGNLPTTNSLVKVVGDLTLDGIVNVTEMPGLTEDTYTLFIYEGALTDNGLDIGAIAGARAGAIKIDAVNKAVNIQIRSSSSVIMIR